MVINEIMVGADLYVFVDFSLPMENLIMFYI